MSLIPDLSPNAQLVDLRTIEPSRLLQMQHDIDQELKLFENSMETLAVALEKFQKSGECLEKFKPENENKQILVPLTGSMYVPGKLISSDRVIVDIGADYFTENDISNAISYFKRKVDFVTEEIQKIRDLAENKNKLREAIMNTLALYTNPTAAKK